MSAQFCKLSKALIKACPGDWILTPNERLAREFRRAYDAYQLDSDRTAWVTPRVAGIDRFVREQAEQVLAFGERPKLLSPESELLLWQELGGRQSESLCELAAEAWRLAHAHRIGLEDQAMSATVNSRAFQRWARRFRARLRQEGLITQAELADLLPGTAERLHLLAFDVVTPQLTDLLRRTERAGGTVRQHRGGAMRKGPHKRVAANTRAAEIHAAAQWARQVLRRYPTARIGVVFPYLTNAYFAIAHAFEVEFADVPDAVNISGGVPLGEQPIWRDAELALELICGEIDHRALQRLRHSPWLDLGIAQRLPRDLPETPGLRHLAKASGVLRGLAAAAYKLPARQPFGAWARAFRSLLTLAGWNGSNAASAQYQAYLRLAECLENFGTLDQLPNLSGMGALQTLKRLLARRLFAAERPPAPVQVLGYLETAGLVFTHLWVAGLQDTDWPAAPTPNPLLPIPLQRQHGVPRVDHGTEAEFAIAQTQGWRRAARYLVTSHAVDEGEERHRCSSLIESVTPVAIAKLVPGFRARRHPWLAEPQGAHLQAVREDRGSPVPGKTTAGGTSLLRDQAQCPFRAWAVHRLGLRESREPQDYPDALERGTLIHDALFILYTGGGPLTDSGIDRAVSVALDRHLQRVPEAYRRYERIRVRALLRTWVRFDAERPVFDIAGLEQEASLTLPGLELSLRIDRIDRDPETGLHLVIDYKTGSVSAKRLLAERLTEPQLPMYALSDTRIRATLYAQINSNGATLKGLASEEVELGPAAVPRLPKTEWNDLTRKWRSRVEALAREFRDGYAAVQPSSPDVCATCHLPAFCRVHVGASTAVGQVAELPGGGASKPTTRPVST